MSKSILALLFIVFLTVSGCSGTTERDTALTIYKSPSCGCCNEWVDHLEEHGLRAQSKHPERLGALKLDLGIARQHASCHTAVTDSGYVFEGHIPASVIRRFLENPPQEALGLAVPRMPVGSPGMEMGNRFEPYEVLLLTHEGGHRVFARINSVEDQQRRGSAMKRFRLPPTFLR